MANDPISRRALLGGAVGVAGLAAMPAFALEDSTEFQAPVSSTGAQQRLQLPDAAVAGLFRQHPQRGHSGRPDVAGAALLV